MEKLKIYCHPRKISSNRLFSIFFSKNVSFTKFFQKYVTVNFRNFHTVYYLFTVWKLRKFTLTHFWQKFRETNVFTIEITKELFSREKNSLRENFAFFHTVAWLFHKTYVKSTSSKTNVNWFHENANSHIQLCKNTKNPPKMQVIL